MAPVKKASTEALENLPDHLTGEIIDGQLIVSPRPRLRHAITQLAIGARLVGPYQDGVSGPGGWWFAIEPQLRLGRHVLVPDLAGWRRERVPEAFDIATISVAPDWVSEVTSPATAKVDRTKKLAIYGEHGVGHLWLVDPLLRLVEVFVREKGLWKLAAVHGGREKVRMTPFEEIRIDLARWWAPPPKGGAAAEYGPEWRDAAEAGALGDR